MSSRNTDRVIVALCDYSEEVCSFEHGNSACSCSHKFGIVLHYGSRVDYEVCTLDIFSTLTNENRNAHFAHCIKSLGFVIVRACQKISLCMEYLCKGIHTRTADTDEVDVLFVF